MIADLLADQCGVVSRRQLLKVGLQQHEIARMLGRGGRTGPFTSPSTEAAARPQASTD
jgi:hypothetical protein